MKKVISIVLTLTLCLSACFMLASCGDTEEGTTASGTEETTAASTVTVDTSKTAYTVGVCQLMEHESLDKATEGFKTALTQAVEAAGKTVNIEVQVAGEAALCTTVINALTAKKVDLLMANATPALLAAANATNTIPVLGTSVTDYNDTFANNIPANVTGTSDAVPFDEQAQMMIDTLGLKEGDQVGVLYCTNESNSLIQYEAVKKLFEEKKIVVKAYTFSETTELQAIVTSAANECKALYVPSDNTVAQNDTIVGSICTDKNVPVFTSYGGAVCYASLAIDYYELGVQTGKMAAEILLGTKTVADFEIATLTPTVVYNSDLCSKLGITVPETQA